MLLSDISQLKEFLPVNTTLDYAKLKPFATDAERIIESTIGSEFYTELDTYLGEVNSGVTVVEAQDKIIKLLQSSISYLVFDLGFDILNTVFSDQGFHRIETENGSKKALFQRQEENLRQTIKQQGYNKLDYALQFLEANKTDYPTWAESEEYTLTLKNFINSAIDFSKVYNINNNRIVFMELRVIQTLVEDFDILPLLGRALFDELKAQIVAGSLTVLNQTLLEFIKKVVAYKCISRGGVDLAFKLSEIGFYLTQLVNSESNIKTKTLDLNMLNLIMDRAEKNGIAYMKATESYLRNHSAEFPLYVPSTARSVFDLKGSEKIGII